MPREALARVLFPLAGYTKDEVRRIAERAGLPVHDKPESQDICFIPAEGHEAFLRGRGVRVEPGEIVDREGRVLGRHRGIACYTIGQRGGLGISSPAPLYVLAIDAARNRLVVGAKGELKSEGLAADQVNWLVDSFPGGGLGQDPLRPPGGAVPGFLRRRSPHGPVCGAAGGRRPRTVRRPVRRRDRPGRGDHQGGLPWRLLTRSRS